MIQSFQCPICGTLNALGEPECSECGQVFVYNCPVCGSPLNNRYPTCPNCHTVFNWGASSQSVAAAASVSPQNAYKQQSDSGTKPGQSKEEGATGYTARPMFWVILIIICAALIALLLIADMFINK